MRFTIAASALFAGLAVAMPAVTITQQSTEIDTITSCGPEVTNCPARSSSTSAPAVPASATSSVPSVSAPAYTPAASSPSSSVVVPVAESSSSIVAPVSESSSAPATTSAPAGPSTIHVYSTEIDTITSCASDVTNCPAKSSQTAYVTGTSVVPAQSYQTLTASSPVAPVASSSYPVGPVASSSAPFPIAGNSTSVAPTGTGSGSSSPSASAAFPSTYTGAASALNANAITALGVVGAFAALLL